MKARGFTLVELLTVVAILGVLAALVLATLSSAKGQAQAASCRNNLAQIGKAIALYTSDFSVYPGTRGAPISVTPRSASNGPPQWDQMWDHRLLPYVFGNRKVFSCPADMTPPGWPPFPPTNSLLTNYSYGYNAFGTAVQFPNLNLGLGYPGIPENNLTSPILEVNESQIRAPSDMVAVGDLTDFPGVFDVTIKPNSPSPYAGAPAARHDGGANIVFCDSHIEFAKRTNWIASTDLARRRWNSDHEPHPETW